MDKNDMTTKSLCIPYMNGSTVTECGEEFTLPDYYPEVRRVVSTLCRVLPESWYDNGEYAEQGGVVTFTVVYLGDDGSLTAVPLTTDYSVNIPMPRADGTNGGVSCDTVAENVTCRATGPRRLSLRARLRAVASGEEYISADTAVTDPSGGPATAAEKISVQTLEDTVSSMRRAWGKATGNVSGEIRERPGTKPIMCDGEILVNEASISEGSVILRGDAVLWCICFGDDGLYYKVTSKAPFEEKLPLSGEDLEAGNARGWGRCASTSVKESDDGTLTWDMEFDLECEAVQNTDVAVARDMYSTMWQGNTVTGESQVLSSVKCGNGRLTLNGTGRKSGSGTSGDHVIGSFGKAVCDRIDVFGSRLTVTGTAEVKVLLCGGGEVTEESVKLPFRYECDSADTPMGEVFWRCDAAAVDTSARLEGDTIHVTAELCLSIFAGVKCPVTYVTKLELDRGECMPSCEGKIRIYYPESGETAWDITKKYGIPRNSIGEVCGDGVVI